MQNANIQRWLVIGSLMVCVLLGLFFGFTWTWISAILLVLFALFVLGVQCVWSCRANARALLDPSVELNAPKYELATCKQWLRAWAAEVVLFVKVFCWWQPFFHRTIPYCLVQNGQKRPLVLVHGFACNRAFWTLWLRKAHGQGRVCIAVDLDPAHASISQYASIVAKAIDKAHQATGLAPVLIGHSMGGLAIRAWAALPNADLTHVHKIITLGTPHQGTEIAELSFSQNGQEMRPGSAWQMQNALLLPNGFAEKCVCYYSNCDNIVFPALMACLPKATHRLAAGLAHVELAFDEQIVQECWASLESS